MAGFTVYGILSEFDKAQCKCYLAYGLDERGSVHITVQQAFPLSNLSSLAVTPYRRSFQQGSIRVKVEVNGTSPSGAVIENAWMYTSTAP